MNEETKLIPWYRMWQFVKEQAEKNPDVVVNMNSSSW